MGHRKGERGSGPGRKGRHPGELPWLQEVAYQRTMQLGHILPASGGHQLLGMGRVRLMPDRRHPPIGCRVRITGGVGEWGMTLSEFSVCCWRSWASRWNGATLLTPYFGVGYPNIGVTSSNSGVSARCQCELLAMSNRGEWGNIPRWIRCTIWGRSRISCRYANISCAYLTSRLFEVQNFSSTTDQLYKYIRRQVCLF